MIPWWAFLLMDSAASLSYGCTSLLGKGRNKAMSMDDYLYSAIRGVEYARKDLATAKIRYDQSNETPPPEWFALDALLNPSVPDASTKVNNVIALFPDNVTPDNVATAIDFDPNGGNG